MTNKRNNFLGQTILVIMTSHGYDRSTQYLTVKVQNKILL
jgi:hypothetical protein